MNTKYIELVSAYLKPQYCLQSIVLRIVLDTLLDLYMMVYLEDVGGGYMIQSGARPSHWCQKRSLNSEQTIQRGRLGGSWSDK